VAANPYTTLDKFRSGANGGPLTAAGHCALQQKQSCFVQSPIGQMNRRAIKLRAVIRSLQCNSEPRIRNCNIIARLPGRAVQ
jgi:hypothetical protein